VALLSFSLSRIALSFVLFVGGVLAWFAGAP
jgi:hypothetical protein